MKLLFGVLESDIWNQSFYYAYLQTGNTFIKIPASKILNPITGKYIGILKKFINF